MNRLSHAAWAAAGVALGVSLIGPAAAETRPRAGFPAGWEGFYVGVTAGARGLGADVSGTGKANTLDLEASSGTLGIVSGYNFQSGPWVWGIEADIDLGRFSDKASFSNLGKMEMSANALGSMRLRGGYAFGSLLVYGTAGLAVADVRITSAGRRDDEVWTGVATGVGLEYKFDGGWLLRGETLFYTFPDRDISVAGSKRDLDAASSSIRLGLVRKW